ncbi:MAG TPA: 3-keto-5-aminohexanoate cleavage protein [Trebonia sp.]|nr:3-keto-5-aminohexanoate cleavage protein [Trebonia sp.]
MAEAVAGPGDPGGGVLLTVAVNGGTSRDKHAGVPVTPDELAAEAREVARAGARAIHVHPRGLAEEQSLAPGDVLPAVAAIRAATGLPVGVTTGIWTVEGDTARRLELVAGWTGPDKPDFASINVNEPGIDDLAVLLVEDLGIAVEAGVWTVDDVDLLASSALATRAFQVLLEPTSTEPATAVAVASQASAALIARGITVPQVHHGYDLATWEVIRWAVRAGFGIRIGLEDTTVLPDGTTAPGNGALATAAMHLAAEA